MSTPDITVIVADDHELVRDGIAALLSAEPDIEVVGTAADGVEAIGLVQSLLPTVVLMDIQMPDMDGMTATSRIRQRERETGRARVPIVALTANAMAHHIEQYLAAGMDTHVSKPIQAMVLFQALVDVTRESAADQAKVA